MLSDRLLISHPMTMISAAGGAGRRRMLWGTTGVFVCVRLASKCVCLTGVCAVSCVSRQTPRSERQHTHFEVVEGCAHPLDGRIYLPATQSPGSVRECRSGCHQLFLWGAVLKNHDCGLPLRMRKRNVIMKELTMTRSTYVISQMSTAVQAKGFIFKTKSRHPVRQRDRKMKTFKSHVYINYLQKLLGDWWHGGDNNIYCLQKVKKYIILMLWRRKKVQIRLYIFQRSIILLSLLNVQLCIMLNWVALMSVNTPTHKVRVQPLSGSRSPILAWGNYLRWYFSY